MKPAQKQVRSCLKRLFKRGVFWPIQQYGPLVNGPSPFTNLYLVLLFHTKLCNNHGKHQTSRVMKNINKILDIKSPGGMKYITLNTRNQVLECNILEFALYYSSSNTPWPLCGLWNKLPHIYNTIPDFKPIRLYIGRETIDSCRITIW